ncbi:MAG TPA: biotin/lipoyl-binding protein [Candidatus Acidoferrales bacterium]|jgi:membrane fusion protein (multidrug efflux system)|nr:biotin/lipoyl-binding protein [Candidatus Acidoferrales bacterium]
MDESPLGQPVSPQNPDTALLIRMLYDEQQRLRAEVDEVREKQQQKQKEKGEKGKDEDQEGGGEKDKDETDSEGEDQNDGKGDKHDENDEEEKKPPLKERMRARKERIVVWKNEHPVASVLILIGIVVVLIGAIEMWRYIESYENTDDAFVDGHTDPISPRISGFIAAIYVENTYRVKRGQLLVQLDPRDYQVSAEQSRANLAQSLASVRAQTPNVPITATSESTAVVNAQLSVASSSANLAAAQGKYQSALAEVAQAEANEANAAQEAERYRLLVMKEEVSRELYDQRATDEKAQAAVVASRKETARAAEKAVAQEQAALKQSEQQAREAEHNRPEHLAIQRETLSMREASLKAAQAQVD